MYKWFVKLAFFLSIVAKDLGEKLATTFKIYA